MTMQPLDVLDSLARWQSGEPLAVLAAEYGVGRPQLWEWMVAARAAMPAQPAVNPAPVAWGDERTTHGLTGAAVRALHRFQRCRCAICETSLGIGSLVIDHNHATGERRGLLCVWCNMAIGRIESYGKPPQFADEAGVARASHYLANPPLRRAAA